MIKIQIKALIQEFSQILNNKKLLLFAYSFHPSFYLKEFSFTIILPQNNVSQIKLNSFQTSQFSDKIANELQIKISPRQLGFREQLNIPPVSYTHLTLPTKRIVQISVVAVSLKKKKMADDRRMS
eukprot:TRINITY_DN5080_c0_g3_i1.p2 TRINITY_DN5080_c0_g3~~TRINITY_DN5080_c0_g3_i1.p2  ORF type:complete len:125 (-),score=17.79 TRINITY_DN5080_c0_g3_i1:59-433(-)